MHECARTRVPLDVVMSSFLRWVTHSLREKIETRSFIQRFYQFFWRLLNHRK